MTTYVFQITCLTNLHAGSGDSGGFGVVDKTVQRDPATNLPTIHASGLKGALREHFRRQPWVNYVFGSDQNDRSKNSSEKGAYHFLSADLLAIPMPVDTAPYYKLVSKTEYRLSLEKKYRELGAKQVSLASTEYSDHEKFGELAEDLPVIARNQLDSGISKNLWYEEVVPRQSVFIVALLVPDADEDKDAFAPTVLVDELPNAVVQIGGNATVGYGFCSFKQIYPQ